MFRSVVSRIVSASVARIVKNVMIADVLLANLARIDDEVVHRGAGVDPNVFPGCDGKADARGKHPSLKRTGPGEARLVGRHNSPEHAESQAPNRNAHFFRK